MKRNINEIVEIVKLQIEEINNLAEVEALTNLYNRRYFENIINDFNLIKLTHEKSDVAEYLTVSMGMAMLRRDDSIENLYKRADLSLYATKNQGRNRLVYLKEKDE